MSGQLGEIRVEERDNCVALIVRTTRRWFPWDVWTIVENEKPDGSKYYGEKDLTYGHSGFGAKRGLGMYYIKDITHWARKVGKRHSQEAAEKLAKKKLEQFVIWRQKQVSIEESMSS